VLIITYYKWIGLGYGKFLKICITNEFTMLEVSKRRKGKQQNPRK